MAEPTPPKSLLDELLERKPFRKALLGAVDKAADKVVDVPIKVGGDLLAERMMKRFKGGSP